MDGISLLPVHCILYSSDVIQDYFEFVNIGYE